MTNRANVNILVLSHMSSFHLLVRSATENLGYQKRKFRGKVTTVLSWSPDVGLIGEQMRIKSIYSTETASSAKHPMLVSNTEKGPCRTEPGKCTQRMKVILNARSSHKTSMQGFPPHHLTHTATAAAWKREKGTIVTSENSKTCTVFLFQQNHIQSLLGKAGHTYIHSWPRNPGKRVTGQTPAVQSKMQNATRMAQTFHPSN